MCSRVGKMLLEAHRHKGDPTIQGSQNANRSMSLFDKNVQQLHRQEIKAMVKSGCCKARGHRDEAVLTVKHTPWHSHTSRCEIMLPWRIWESRAGLELQRPHADTHDGFGSMGNDTLSTITSQQCPFHVYLYLLSMHTYHALHNHSSIHPSIYLMLT